MVRCFLAIPADVLDRLLDVARVKVGALRRAP
jgi:hypothetical protein